MAIETLNKNIAKIGTNIVNARYNLTSTENKFIRTIIAQIDINDTNLTNYDITVSQLEDKWGVEQNELRLKQFAKNLCSKPLEVATPRGWLVANWFSSIEYIAGEARFECRIDDKLRPYLLELKNRITKVDLKYILPMRSTYSIRIYELLKEYEKIGHRDFDLAELQNILQVPKSMLIYANFKTKVLDVAVAEINKFSDKEVSYKALKKIRKKVIAIRFEIKKNWLDLKAFIEFIREYYPNRRLYIYKGGYVACSLKGMLYYYDVENRPTLSKEAARKCWEYLHENRTKLDIFQPTLF